MRPRSGDVGSLVRGLTSGYSVRGLDGGFRVKLEVVSRATRPRAPLSAARAMLGFLLVLLLAAPAAANTVPTVLEGLVTAETGSVASSREARHRIALQRFYAERSFLPIWVSDSGPTSRARELVEVIGKAEDDGLHPSDYDHAGLMAAVVAAEEATALAELEYRLSRALLEYGNDLGSGRVEPREVDRELYVDPRPFDPMAALAGAASARSLSTFLASYAPRTPNYERLKQALADYRAIAARGGWPIVPQGETLRPGDRDTRVAAVRARLRVTGELSEAAVDEELYDDTLAAAVRIFQDRHGLDVDGAIGPKTLTALNVSATQRVEQILLNMERRRWMADDLGERYVFVNLADFELKLVEGTKTVLDSRVVIGDDFHRTPVFSGDMTYLVLNPNWNVPPSIATKELLPKIRRNVNYLRNNNFKLFSGWGADAHEINPANVDWSQVSARRFPYKIRQEPGDGNALGRVKFMFPNEFNIYLHDTPSRGLFSRSVRNFSHGCIRVGKPLELAEMLLRHDPEWTRERIDAVIASGRQQIVKLKTPVKVHITYLTAWVNKDGSVYFHDDVYGRDARLERALQRDRREASL